MPEIGIQTEPESPQLPQAVPVEPAPVAQPLPQAVPLLSRDAHKHIVWGMVAFAVVLVSFFTAYSFSAQVNVTQVSAGSRLATMANITTAMARITALEQNVAGLESAASKLVTLDEKAAAAADESRKLNSQINKCMKKGQNNTNAIKKVQDELKTVSVKAAENPDLEPPHECGPDDAVEKKVQANYVEQFATLAELNKNVRCFEPVRYSDNLCTGERHGLHRFNLENNAQWVTQAPVDGANVFNVAIKTYHLVNVPQEMEKNNPYHRGQWKNGPHWTSNPTPRTTLGWAIIRPDALDTGTRVSRDIQSILDNNSDNDDIAQLLSHRLGGSGTNIINVILQTPCINRVSYLQFEMKIYACIKNHNASAIVKFDVKYPSYVPESTNPYRPTEIKYTAWFDRGCESMSMLFLNPL